MIRIYRFIITAVLKKCIEPENLRSSSRAASASRLFSETNPVYSDYILGKRSFDMLMRNASSLLKLVGDMVAEDKT